MLTITAKEPGENYLSGLNDHNDVLKRNHCSHSTLNVKKRV